MPVHLIPHQSYPSSARLPASPHAVDLTRPDLGHCASAPDSTSLRSQGNRSWVLGSGSQYSGNRTSTGCLPPVTDAEHWPSLAAAHPPKLSSRLYDTKTLSLLEVDGDLDLHPPPLSDEVHWPVLNTLDKDSSVTDSSVVDILPVDTSPVDILPVDTSPAEISPVNISPVNNSPPVVVNLPPVPHLYLHAPGFTASQHLHLPSANAHTHFHAPPPPTTTNTHPIDPFTAWVSPPAPIFSYPSFLAWHNYPFNTGFCAALYPLYVHNYMCGNPWTRAIELGNIGYVDGQPNPYLQALIAPSEYALNQQMEPQAQMLYGDGEGNQEWQQEQEQDQHQHQQDQDGDFHMWNNDDEEHLHAYPVQNTVYANGHNWVDYESDHDEPPILHEPDGGFPPPRMRPFRILNDGKDGLYYDRETNRILTWEQMREQMWRNMWRAGLDDHSDTDEEDEFSVVDSYDNYCLLKERDVDIVEGDGYDETDRELLDEVRDRVGFWD